MTNIMIDKILHKLEKYRNKIKYEEKHDEIYLEKLNLYLNTYLNKYLKLNVMSGGGVFNFETVDIDALINTGGIKILFGTYFPANIQIRGKSTTKTVFEYIIVPYGSAIPIYMYYYLDELYHNNRRHIYLRNIRSRKQLPRVTAQTYINRLKLYIYAYNQELAIGSKDIKDEIKDHITNLRINFDSKFTSGEKRRMVEDAQDSKRFNQPFVSYGNNETDLYNNFGDYEPGEAGEPGEIGENGAPKSIISKTTDKYNEIKKMLEQFIQEKFRSDKVPSSA